MIEPQSEVEANLHTAVELGQRLLRRNQTLLEEQVTFRRQLEAKDATLADLQVKLRRMEAKAGGGSDKVEEMLDARLRAERELNVSLDRLVDLQRTVDELRRAAANSRDKETIEGLHKRLDHMMDVTQRKDEEIKKLDLHTTRTEALVATLRDEIVQLRESVSNSPDAVTQGPVLTRQSSSNSSFGFSEFEGEDSKEVRRRVALEKQVEYLESANEELARTARQEQCSLETKEVIISALQNRVTELQRKVEELTIESSRLRYAVSEPDGNFETMVNAVTVKPVESLIVNSCSLNSDLEANSSMMELIDYKVRCTYRDAADQEFLERWKRLEMLLESSRLSIVEKDLLERGEATPTIEELKSISTARLNDAEDHARLLQMSPVLKALPYSTVIFAHMVKHVGLQKAMNQTIINLKRLQLETGHQTPKKSKSEMWRTFLK